ncbi:thermostable beta-glucosidase B [Sodiomyces alkalinus F11]|uniref:beta-glucosidase n=1 Tax=Sodiomyces alkalinus (strain CBS 110278 / VKM F-3762 / F11) TaxID=1314773 RepID=A0A3N2PNL9_SODAK|nr:thermostable beta-glucosidase B [Sodiomyces alkalinus F11]ROT36115.1 thermostable beta-glucosidase B [Sodiomyces alkalinus F11]
MAPVDVNEILSKLTLEEKISILAGANFWETVGIPEKGVPVLKTSDGPNGARGGTMEGGATSACFPAACSVASTFDVDLAQRIGTALGKETLTKGARCLLAPTMCIHRHPLGGRNFESFSEDPFLSGKLAARNVIGVQSTGVSATIKHYAANEQETQRLTVDEEISERALREIYLKPFEISIKEANPGAVMTAYNMVNGIHADSHPFLLQKVLRGDWGWDGLVMSDWGGVNSTAEALNAGLDLEMPGPARWRKIPDVLAAVSAGKVTEQTINERALRMLRFLEREKCFEDPTIPAEQSIDKPEDRALIREAGARGIVLLKNEGGILPLTREKARGKKVALLGYAKQALIHGGGSASVSSHYRVTPWDGLRAALGDDVELTYAKGAHTFRRLPLLSENVVGLDGTPGFTYNVYSPGHSTPIETKQGHPNSELSVFETFDLGSAAPGAGGEREFELIGHFTSPVTSTYYFNLSGLGPSKFAVDDKVIYEQPANCSDFMGYMLGGVPVPRLEVPMEAGKRYKVQVFTNMPRPVAGVDLGIFDGRFSVRLGGMAAVEYHRDILAEAVEVAKGADYAIVFTGHDPDWETEGQDQSGFHLPREGSQDNLVAAVAAENPNTVVVNSTGVAVAMPWLGQVKGLLQTWFPGQEAGNSIADVLTGARTPEGHLTCTFPKRLEDTPAYGNFPGEYVDGQLKVKYAEGVFVGYRHFDRLPADKVNFPFGFGLSYTTFDYADLDVKEVSADEYAVSVRVSNTGGVKGAVAVQVYVGHANPAPENPVKVLAGFKKVALEAGESQTVLIPVGARDFAFWSEGGQRWVVAGGEYKFSVGKSAGDLVLSAAVQVGEKTYAP